MNPSNRRDSSAMAEEIQVLGAISQVSARLARKLTALANLRQTQEGGKNHEPNERDGSDHVEALIIVYGDGRNGKSTFWNVISRVLGLYSGSDFLT